MDVSVVPGREVGGEAPTAAPRTDGPRRSGGAGLSRPARSLVRLLYTSNPFYILSADLVFVGLRMSFGPHGPAGGSWALAGSLAGYTLLLAAAACVLIRYGRLWDDLRTLLLLVVMMFLAIALTCDDTMAADPRRGAMAYVGGLAFAVAVTEVVLHTIRLKLPARYRLAYYAILALEFLYPAAMSPLLGDPENPALQWALFGFSPMAALAVAALVPAARRGRPYMEKNGSPWRWPLYPWALFVVMVGGLCVRSWSLCVSFHYVEGSRTIFGPYFLVPIGLAVALVWMEIGLASGRRGVVADASLLPMALALLALFGHRDDPVYRQFLERFTGTLGGSPAYLALWGSLAFLGYIAWRRFPISAGVLAVNLVALSVIGPRTIGLGDLVWPRALPMGAAGLVLAAVAWRRRDSGRSLWAAACLVLAGSRWAGDRWDASASWPVALHLSVVALMLVGALFRDDTGWRARLLGAIALVCLGLDASTGTPRIWPSMPRELIAWYPLLVAGWAWGFSLLARDPFYEGSAAVSLIGWLSHSGSQTYLQLRKVVVGLDQIAWGMLFFLVAMAISLKKAGLWPDETFQRFVGRFHGKAKTLRGHSS